MNAPTWTSADQAAHMRAAIANRAATEPDSDWQRGMRDAEAVAVDFPEILTHSMRAPAGKNAEYKAGWRVGFGNVRNMLVNEGQAAAAVAPCCAQFSVENLPNGVVAENHSFGCPAVTR